MNFVRICLVIAFTARALAAPGDLDLTFGRTGKLLTPIGADHDNGEAMVRQSDGGIVVVGSSFNGDLDGAIVRYLPDGSLDPSFANGGEFIADLGRQETAYAVALQADGKIVVALEYVDGANSDIVVLRIHPAGTLDTTFGTGGIAFTNINQIDTVRGMAVQSDGKIVVAGSTEAATTDWVLVRYDENGFLDPTFNGTGIVTTDFGGADEARALAIQPLDGRIVVVGRSVSSTSDFAVARYETNGALDTSFNGTGKATLDFAGENDAAAAVALQADGMIVVGGARSLSGDDFAVARYQTNGQLDPGFGSGGKVATEVVGGTNRITGMAVQGDGKIVASGLADSLTSSDVDFGVVRYEANGTLDATFGSGGIVTTDVGTQADFARALLAQADGRIVVAGSGRSAVTPNDFALVRYEQDGTLDSGFGAGVGKVTTKIGTDFDEAFAVALQPDGKVVVAGKTGTGAGSDLAVVRYDRFGGLDPAFNGTGRAVTTFGNFDEARGVAVQADGKILVVGGADNGSNLDFAVVRYLANGSLDPAFNGTGKATTNFGANTDSAQAVAVQSDGKIVVAGYARVGSSDDFAVARYLDDGTLDPAFNGTGKVTANFGGSSTDRGHALAVQSDGKIVVAGVSGTHYAVARYLANGTLDPGFNGSGLVTTTISTSSAAFGVAVQSDGKIVVAGEASNGFQLQFALTRYLADGTLDPAFNGSGIVVAPLSGMNDQGRSVAVLGNGKILVAGFVGFSTNGPEDNFGIARFNPNGSIDSSFHEDVVIVTPIGTAGDYGQALAVQRDGKIVVAGYAFVGGTRDFAVVRYAGDPVPIVDTVVPTAVATTQAVLRSQVNPNGLATMVHFEYGTSPTLAGASATGDVPHGSGTEATPFDQVVPGLVPNTTYYYRVVATNAAGTSVGSILSFATLPSAPAVTTLAATGVTGRKAILHASVDAFGQATTVSFAYGTDAALAGATTTSAIGVGSGQGAVALDEFLGGLAANTTYYFRAMATNATGTSAGAILSFTTNYPAPGDVQLGFDPGVTGTVSSLAVQADRKIVIGGSFSAVGGAGRANIARVNPDGTLDPAFDPGVTGGLGQVLCTVVQPDGKIIIGGDFMTVGGMIRRRLARVHADGTLDAAFAPDVNGTVRCLALLPDGKILAGGDFTEVAAQSRGFLVRLGTDGSLDGTFNNPGLDAVVKSLAVQSDGKIVIGGDFTMAGGEARGFIARLESDGALDMSFDPQADAGVRCVALLESGSIVIGGSFGMVGGVARNTLARLAASGALDMAFDPSPNGTTINSIVVDENTNLYIAGDFTMVGSASRRGVARIDGFDNLAEEFFHPDVDSAVLGVALEADGSVLLAGGFANIGGFPRTGLTRLQNGPAFDSLTVPFAGTVQWERGGVAPVMESVTFELSTDGGANWTLLGAGMRVGLGWWLQGLSLPPSGTLRVRGRTSGGLGNGSSSLVETVSAFPPSGSVDGGFGAMVNSTLDAIAVQADGKIVIGGFFNTVGGTPRNRIARLNADGTLDVGFDPGGGADNNVSCVVVQPDGRLLVGGLFANIDGQPRVRLARLLANGALDGTFSAGAGPNAFVSALALEPDGKILVCGSFSTIDGQSPAFIARLNADGTVDSSFVPDVNGAVFSMARQSDGRIVIGGNFTMVGGMVRTRVARLEPTGALDATFDPGAGANNTVFTIAVQADGKVLLSGSFNDVGGQPRGRIARLHADGSVESTATFDTGSGIDGFPFGYAESIVLQADGKILIAGDFDLVNGQFARGVARLRSDGGLEERATFNPGTGFFDGAESLALQADGQVLVSALLTGGLARLRNDPASQSLTSPDTARAQWLRGGSSPEVARVTFELSPDGVTNWTPLGAGSRIAGGWEVTGLALPAGGYLRARGYAPSGRRTGSSGLVEALASFGDIVTDPPTLTAPAASTRVNNPITVDFTLPEAALAGSVRLTFTGAVTRQLVLAASQETAANHSFTFDSTNPTASPEIASGAPIPDGTYAVTLSYQDALGHPAEVATATGVTIITSVGGTFFPLVIVAGPLPDYTGQAADSAGAPVLVTQSPSPGTGVAAGTVRVTLTALNVTGTNPSTSFDVFVVASEAPDPVVQTDGQVMNEPPGTVFVEFGTPAVDRGEVGGVATITSGRVAQTIIFGGEDGAVLARTGGSAPGGATFASLGDPVFGGGAFGFAGKSKAPGRLTSGLFSKLSTMVDLNQLAVLGGAAPGVTGGKFAKLPSFGLPRKRPGVVFTGTLKRGSGVTKANDFGVWREKTSAPGESDLLVRTGDVIDTSAAVKKLELMIPVTNATDQRRSFAPDGGVTTAATFADGSVGVVRVKADGTKDVPIDSKSDVPGLPGARFLKVSAPATGNRGVLAFHAALRAAARGLPAPASQVIMANRDGTFRPLVRVGETVPGNPQQRFARLGQPLMGQDGLLAFIAALQGTGVNSRNKTALVQINGADERRIVARLGDQAKGFPAGAVYQRFQSVVVTDTPKGHIVFTGTVSGGGVTKRDRQAIWSAVGDEDVKLILRSDQLVIVGAAMPKLRVFEALTAKPASKGQGRSTDDVGFVTAKVRLSDGRSGVLRIPLPEE